MNISHLHPGINTIQSFQRQHGRPLRVLHIGNVANNAYQNAKLLNVLGADCDVICRDYYHLMACPEWEDADFSSAALDQSNPDWTTTNLNGYERPKWFVQGPEIFCLDYLLARRAKNRLENKYWRFLSVSNGTAKAAILSTSDRIERQIRLAFEVVSRHLMTLREPPTLLIKRIKSRLSANGVDITHGKGLLSHFVLVLLVLMTAGALLALLAPFMLVRYLYHAAYPAPFDKAVVKLASVFPQIFPGRTDNFTIKDVQSLYAKSSKWAKLFAHYDLVHAYATEGIIPLLAEKPFVAFEHGTLREIPFEATPQGRCCALSYRLADYVLITNADNRDAAGRLGVLKYTFVPHMVNESYLPNAKQKHDLYLKLHEDLASSFIVFCPPRHHWSVERRLEGDKGNDIFLTGFAKFIKEREPGAKAILVKWGSTLEKSVSLIERLGIASNVRWIPPQPHPELTRLICGSDLVADQFVVPAFGNVMPKALLCGRPAIVFLDEGKHSWCFDSMPPVINAKNPEEVYAGLCKVREDMAFVNDLIIRGHDWYFKYHSNKRVGDILQSSYASVLSESYGLQL